MQDGALRSLLDGGPRLTVGMMTADLLHLGAELELLERGRAELVHIDVMDGVFCPMLTVGPPVIRSMRTTLLKDAHLMITDPLTKIDAYVAAGADMITFQVEGAPQPHRVLQALGKATNVNDASRGIVRGVAVNPGTPLQVLEPLLDEVDYILVLAVNPGWGGQPFISTTARRVERVRQMAEDSGNRIVVGVDGAVTRDNIADVAAIGADIIVSGSAIFDGRDVADNLRHMLDAVARAGSDRERTGDLLPT
jgi:ribulose-phosphate 3-epimerase